MSIVFPDVFQGELSEEDLDALAADLRSLAGPVSIRVKGEATDYSAGSPSDVAESFAVLRAGTIRAVQFSYQHEEKKWIDTVTRRGDLFFLIRTSLSPHGEGSTAR